MHRNEYLVRPTAAYLIQTLQRGSPLLSGANILFMLLCETFILDIRRIIRRSTDLHILLCTQILGDRSRCRSREYRRPHHLHSQLAGKTGQAGALTGQSGRYARPGQGFGCHRQHLPPQYVRLLQIYGPAKNNILRARIKHNGGQLRAMSTVLIALYTC